VRHAEAVLFVHDHEPEPPEPDRGLDEGVGAHEDVELARRERFEERLPGAPARFPGQEAEAHAGLVDPGRETRRVLLREDFRRRHERALHPVLRGQEQRQPRHDRLAAADIPLEEAGHRASGRQVGADLPQGALLRVRQRKRQRFPRGFADARVGCENDPGARSQARAFLLDSGREHEELLPGPAARGPRPRPPGAPGKCAALRAFRISSPDRLVAAGVCVAASSAARTSCRQGLAAMPATRW
jgi:hypothetical protein